MARKTDLIKATKLSDHCELYLKTENLQKPAASKLRGAYYKISQLSEEEKQHGILACTPETTPRVWPWPPPRAGSNP